MKRTKTKMVKEKAGRAEENLKNKFIDSATATSSSAASSNGQGLENYFYLANTLFYYLEP